MNWTTYNLELITPTFIAGFDQRRAEIRIPSIRGQVRWWFRALGGTAKEESGIFGGVHGGAKRSRVYLRLKAPVISEKARNLFELGIKDMNLPQAYLLWPLRPTKSSDQRRGVLDAGTVFDLRARVSPDLSTKLAERFASALKAWILLGSLGTRSRRGYGSIGPAPGCETLPPPASLHLFKSGMAEVLKSTDKTSLRVLALSEGYGRADEALDHLGRWLKGFRAGSRKSGEPSKWGKNDHDTAKSGGDRLYRPVIGLPLEQRFSDGSRLTTVKPNCDRWASPVHLKVIRCGQTYYPLAVFFPLMAMEDRTELWLEPKGGTSQQRQKARVDRELFEEMMKSKKDTTLIWG